MVVGKGFLKTAWVTDRTEIIRAQASNPLKLLCPRRSQTAWVYTTTFGGGLVAGDHIDLNLEIGDGTSCVLTSQSSTKVYKCPQGQTTRQTTQVAIGEEALLVIAPDPMTCFAGSRYQQEQRLDLAKTASLVLVDWLTSGRRARDECWKFSRYSSQIDLRRADQRIFFESLLLDPIDGPLNSPYRLGKFHCMALLVLVGPIVQQAAEAILSEISNQPIEPGIPLIQAVSEIPGGIVLRIMGCETEQVSYVLQERLDFLLSWIGEGPWSRKW
ncbi:MAG: urease accessory protein UreD [Pirellulaceae bacterium]|nr:urease accessory protein UreD [Pirellulaceae bacterium]